MKKSELRQIIKEEIENISSNINKLHLLKDKLENLFDEYGSYLDKETLYKFYEFISEVANSKYMDEATIETSPENLAKVKQLSKPEDIIKIVKEEEEEDDEDDEDKLDKKATAAAKKSNTKSKRLDSIIKSLKDLTNEMKLLAKDFTSSKDEKEKDKIKNILKEKTKIKKELEDTIKKLTNGIS